VEVDNHQPRIIAIFASDEVVSFPALYGGLLMISRQCVPVGLWQRAIGPLAFNCTVVMCKWLGITHTNNFLQMMWWRSGSTQQRQSVSHMRAVLSCHEYAMQFFDVQHFLQLHACTHACGKTGKARKMTSSKKEWTKIGIYLT